jgi:hypothetical protein
MLAFRSILIALLTSVLDSMAKGDWLPEFHCSRFPIVGRLPSKIRCCCGGGLMFVNPHVYSFTDTTSFGGARCGWTFFYSGLDRYQGGIWG